MDMMLMTMRMRDNINSQGEDVMAKANKANKIEYRMSDVTHTPHRLH